MKRLILSLCMCALCAGAAAQRADVNLFMGTEGDNGQVSPGAAAPFGLACVAPDSKPRQHAGYDYAVDTISGISVNRLSGVGCGGAGGNLSLRPALPTSVLRIVKGTEVAEPGYYATRLSNGVQAEFTTTGNVAVERYRYPQGTDAMLYINFLASFEPRWVTSEFTGNGTSITGFFRAHNNCGVGFYKIYFHMVFDHPYTVAEQTEGTMTLRFDARTVEVRIGLSSVDTEGARQLVEGQRGRSFNDIRKGVAKEWDRMLDAIRVKGGTSDLRTIFYTSLYRTILSPSDVTAPDGRFHGSDNKTYRTEGYRYYASWSMWDTFRTKFPLIALLYPQHNMDMCKSLIHLYTTGKEAWSTMYEAAPNCRTEHTILMLLDAYNKGCKELDFSPAYEWMRYEEETQKLNSPDQKLEAVLDYWAFAQVAEICGMRDDAQLYRHKADSLFEATWKKEFMEVTPDFHVMKDNGLYQGSRWQYRWAVPQYIDKMIAWKGREKLEEELTYFFAHDLYNQGNEPDIHVPYLFNRVGAPAKTQQVVRDLITKEMKHVYGGNAEYPVPYVGLAYKNTTDGYMPEMDEDDGALSAWYIFGCIGLYPLQLGTEYYELCSPLFDDIVIRVGQGRQVHIKVAGRRAADDPIRKVTWNGTEINDYRIAHSRLVQGGTLTFFY